MRYKLDVFSYHWPSRSCWPLFRLPLLRWPLIVGCFGLLLASVYSIPSSFADANNPHAKVFMYRYQDAQGNKVMAQQIPAESYKYGYEALDMMGRVLFKVDPELSEEQKKIKQRKRVLDERNRALLKVYSSPEDAIRAKERKLQQLDVTIEITEGKINQLRLQYEHVLEMAANHEKKGYEVSERMLEDMASVDSQIKGLENFIENKQQEKQKIASRYDLVIEQLSEIEGGSDAAAGNPRSASDVSAE